MNERIIADRRQELLRRTGKVGGEVQHMSTPQHVSSLVAGAGMADITPELGIQLAGDIGRLRPTEEISAAPAWRSSESNSSWLRGERAVSGSSMK